MTPPVRLANEADAVGVRELDTLAFSAGGQPAEPGELEAGVAAGDVHVLVKDGVLAGYVHVDTSRSGRIYVAGVAVRPGLQRQGLGCVLIDHMLDLLGSGREVTPVVTVTAPTNVPMLKILFKRGFSARWYLPDHFGPGMHRFGCQLLAPGPPPDPDEGVRVPLTRLDEAADIVRSFTGSDASPATVVLELFPTRPSDFLPADPPHHLVDPAERNHERLSRGLLDQVLEEDIRSSYNDGTW
jgi:ribosomal protein S18 acetylase RimI-like enzyme